MKKVTKNEITGFTVPTQRGLLIDFVGEQVDGYSGYFSGSGVITRSTDPCLGNIITHNDLKQGSYGVNLVGSEDNIITNNYCKGQNHRSIFLGGASWGNLIANNQLRDFLSTAVHLSYGCSNNKIHFNTCIRDIGVKAAGTGEGVIQAYVGCTNNEIIGNTCSADTNYGIYTAIDSIDNTIRGNTISEYYLAAIAVENDWESSLPTNSFYSKPNYGAPPSGSTWAFNNAAGNIIEDNTINAAATGRNVCGIYIAQIDAVSALSTTGTIVKGNKVVSADQIQFNIFIYAETAVNLSGIKFEGNLLHSGNPCASYNAAGTTTWNDKIAYWEGNEQLDELLMAEPIAIADADLTPSVSTNANVNSDRMFEFNNASAASVTDFDDGYDGQTIFLRGDSNTTIVYTSGLIRTKGLVNVTGMSANSLISFKLIGAIWYEMWRNF